MTKFGKKSIPFLYLDRRFISWLYNIGWLATLVTLLKLSLSMATVENAQQLIIFSAIVQRSRFINNWAIYFQPARSHGVSFGNDCTLFVVSGFNKCNWLAQQLDLIQQLRSKIRFLSSDYWICWHYLKRVQDTNSK